MESARHQKVIAQGFKNHRPSSPSSAPSSASTSSRSARTPTGRSRPTSSRSGRRTRGWPSSSSAPLSRRSSVSNRPASNESDRPAVFENLGRFGEGFGRSPGARTATSAIGRAFETLTSRIRNTNRVFTEGTQTSLTRREGLIRGRSPVRNASSRRSVTRQQRTIQRLNQSLSTGVTGALTGRGLGVGLAGIGGGVGFASLLSSGFERFSNLERINKQFLALTGNIEDTNMLLGQVKDFAKKTPFDLVGVADLAKGFLRSARRPKDVLPSP